MTSLQQNAPSTAPAKPAKPRPILPPGAVLLRAFLLTSWLWFFLPWIFSLITLSGTACYQLTPASTRADLRSIHNRLARGDEEKMHDLFPEGRLFSHSFYGFTLINIAAANPTDTAFRTHTLAELEKEIPAVEHLATQAPFDRNQSLTPKGGIIPAGHANLLRAGYALLGGTNPAILQAFHTYSAALADAFAKSPTGSLETYASQTWPVDNIVALESLRLHDVLFHTTYKTAGTRWADWMKSHLDGATGLMNMQIDDKGNILDGPRGCGLSWILAFLPAIDPDLAQSQYAIYRRDFFLHPLGTTGIREFPPTRSGTFMDSDTGPIIFDMGTAATGFGIAAAKANHDPENLTGLLRALEITSAPTYHPDLTHDHFLGQVLLADEIALWGKTLCRWDARQTFPPQPSAPAGLRNYWIVPTTFLLLGTLITFLFIRSLRKAFSHAPNWPRPLPKPHILLFTLALLTVPAFLLIPGMNWLYTTLTLALLEILGTRLFPLKPK